MNSGDPVILFDGACNLCNATVRFVVRRDPHKRFRLAPLQSEAGRALLARRGAPADELASVVLVADGRVYRRSAAILRILRRLRGLWPSLFVLIVVPAPLRDWVYDYIGRHRYRWFGKRDLCQVSDDLRDRLVTGE